METKNFLITGVGGQGTVLASELIAAVGVAAGYDVKKSDILGLSVRGGGVVGHVRWGDVVYSPIVPEGKVDYLVAFEKLEGLRWVDQMKPDGQILINQQVILPVIVSSGLAKYPQDEQTDEAVTRISRNYLKIPAIDMALSLGNSRVVNVVLLGALSCLLDVQPEVWEGVLAERVPSKHFEVNKSAFHAGRDWMKGKRS
jgi:indolepyruvate ferredoxin oxidoreductase beta subunit